MICPDCGYDNIDGVVDCEACGQPLVDFDPSGGELERSITRHLVDVLCPKTPVSIESTCTTREAIQTLVDNKIGCLLVVQSGTLIGVFSERDVLNKISTDLNRLDQPVMDFMTSSPQTITKHETIAYALHAMDLGGYRHQPVVDETGQPTGIISIRDILRFLCIRFGEIRSKAS